MKIISKIVCYNRRMLYKIFKLKIVFSKLSFHEFYF